MIKRQTGQPDQRTVAGFPLLNLINKEKKEMEGPTETRNYGSTQVNQEVKQRKQATVLIGIESLDQ
jgi:hypothetical protein